MGFKVKNNKKQKETEQREEILQKLSTLDIQILQLAYFYAVDCAEFGVDVTKKWVTLCQNHANLERAYHKGYCEGLNAAKTWDKAKEDISKACTDKKKESQNPKYKFEIGQIVGKVNGYPNPLTFKVLDRFVVNLIHPYYKIGLIDRFFSNDSQETVPNHYEYVPEDRLKFPDEDNAHISTFKFHVGDIVKFKNADHGLFRIVAKYGKSNAYEIRNLSDGGFTVANKDQLELASKSIGMR